MRLLDCGCGPGSITLGLAEAVHPGEVVGIDPNPDRLELARAASAQRGISNVRFEQGDVHALGFPSESFDAALVHAVMEHLEDPVGALQKLRRVLRPGGVLGVRSAEHTADLIAPPIPNIALLLDLYRRQKERIGQNAQIGRSLRGLLRQAGFKRVVGSASLETAGTLQATRQTSADLLRNFSAAPWVDDVIEWGWIDPQTVDQVKAAVKEWGENPDAFFSVTWCEALGWAE
jgi:ubiquinone/menaquinone biosynthesis C-methylase UbiE